MRYIKIVGNTAEDILEDRLIEIIEEVVSISVVHIIFWFLIILLFIFEKIGKIALIINAQVEWVNHGRGGRWEYRSFEDFDGNTHRIIVSRSSWVDVIQESPFTCPICIDKKNMNVVRTPCCHLFHRQCLQEWWDIQNDSGKNPECPMCRKMV